MRQTGEKLNKAITVLITWGLLLSLFVAYERYFVSGQEAFLKERAFHSLERLFGELNAQIQRARLSTSSFVKLRQDDHPKEFLELYLKDALTEDAIAAASVRRHKKACSVQSKQHGLTVTFSCAAGGPIYTLDLAPWIKTAFQPMGGEFDDVLIADATGRVLFQKSSNVASITDLKSLVIQGGNESKQKSSESSTTNNPVEQGTGSLDNTGKKKDNADGDLPRDLDTRRFKKLTDASYFMNTTLAGLSYKLFSVPALENMEDDSPDKRWSFVVCGLKRSDIFDSDSHAIPYSRLIWATLIGVAIFTLSWPLAKLRYMSNTERFTPKEGWFLILTMALAATSITLMLLNGSYTSQAQSETDRYLRDLAGEIKHNFRKEMELASKQIQELNPEREHTTLTPDYLDKGSQSLDTYPFFDIAFWVDRKGEQVRKIDLRPAATPIVNVGKFPSFTNVVTDEEWSVKRYYLDPEISTTTAEFAPVLAVPFTMPSKDRIKVQALSVRPMSLVGPILPPGYGFAVVDPDCGVLFHSEVFRNKKDNFCQESKGNSELQPWLFGANDGHTDISYAGRPERALITSMPPVEMPNGATLQFAEGPVHLIVFRIADYALTLNLAIVLVCTILLGLYFLVLLTATGLYMSLRGPLHLIDARRPFWPCAENDLKYVEIFAANAIILLSYWLLYPHFYEAPLLALTILTAALCALSAILRLSCHGRVLFHFGFTVTAISATVLATMVITHKSAPANNAITEWWAPAVLLGIGGVVAVLLSCPLDWGERLCARIPISSARAKHLMRTHLAATYSLAALTVITAVSVVPCVGFFKFAFDAVSEMALKHDQIELSQSLLARRDRIKGYYRALGGALGPKMHCAATQRMDSTLDRYDKDFGFSYREEPKLSSIPGAQSNQCDAIKPLNEGDSFTESINVAIERAIAAAVLVFPANPLGAEMSKLGVASSTGEEYSFSEPEANRFTLSWKPESRLSGLMVDSQYSKWRGLPWWGYACALLFWCLLGVWLTRVLRKIFLTDVQKLRASDIVSWNDVSDIQGNFLVVGLAKSGKSESLRPIAGLSPKNYWDLRVELKLIMSGASYPHPESAGSVVIMDEFDFNLKDREYNLLRLNLLEHVLYESECRIVLVSSVDPLYVLVEGAPEILSDPMEPELARKLLDRWARALSNFERVRTGSPGNPEFRKRVQDFIRSHPHLREFALWVRQECHGTSMLRKIGLKILDEFTRSGPITRSWVESNVLDRAGDYYRVLWSGLTTSERLVLYQLALDGWANPKNTAALQQLESKCLIRRTQGYRIMNESFRCFVACTEHADEIAEWEKQEKQSTWRVVRLVMIGLALAAGIWLLHSQAALSQQLAAYIAGVATLVTAVSTLFSRSGKQTAVKGEAN
jgi:hypothetical protein